MSTDELAKSMLLQARQRLKVLPILLEDGAFSVVMRESQEVVELCLKGLLRVCGIEPPKIHDVGKHLLANEERLSQLGVTDIDQLAAKSLQLRKERELSFYGDADFIPTEAYDYIQAEAALGMARFCVERVSKAFPVE